MDKGLKYVFFLAIGFLIAFFAFRGEDRVETVTKTEFKSDTVYVTIRDTIFISKDRIKQEYLRDTVLIEPFQPVIKAFTASEPNQYGNTTVTGEVLGEVLKMRIYNDWRLPTVTNTITNTTTITKRPSGLFITGGLGVRKQLNLYVGAVFIRDRYLIGINTSGFQVGYRLK